MQTFFSVVNSISINNNYTYIFTIIFNKYGKTYTSNKEEIKLKIIEKTNITQYFLSINLLLPLLLTIILIKLLVNIIL